VLPPAALAAVDAAVASRAASSEGTISVMALPPPLDPAAWLAAIIDSSDDAIVSKTLEGTITSWNRAAEAMFGYTAAEAVGRHITLIIPPERHAEENEVLAKIRRGERVEHFDTIRVAKDGRRLDISLTVSPIRDATGHVTGASKIARDITERKQVERERNELLAAAQAANLAKDAFLAMFGHELRNPLAAIASAVQVLALAGSVHDVTRPRSVIERQVRHLTRLVDELLDASRVQTGKITLERRPLNLREAVDHALDVLRGGATPGRHTLVVDTDDVGVSADPVRLEQVVLNLLANAVKYTPAGRTIAVTVRAEGDDAVLAVRDEGVGISATALPRIFDLFVQGDMTLDRVQGGLGIGLTLVQTLVRLHGGTVTAASDGPGRGSVFTVRLPRVELDPSAETVAPPLPLVGHRILIVEDNEDSREMLRVVLERQGQEVFEAGDGAEGVAVASRVRPHLAFVDLGLPVMDGYEVARQLRRLPEPPARLIALTGYGQVEDRRRCLEAGFDDHIVKPIDPLRLAQLLRS
jgi:PAS domain S-box-containing protein